MDFSMSKTNDVATLRIVGELDAVTTRDLLPSIAALLAERHPRVVVDVSGLRLIDSLCDQPAAIFKLLHLDRVLQA